MKLKNKIIYKILSVMWFIFGCIFIALPILAKGDMRSIILGLIASFLFFTTSYLNWKKYKESNKK